MKNIKLHRLTSLLLALCMAISICNSGVVSAMDEQTAESVTLNCAFDALDTMGYITEDFALLSDGDSVSRALYLGNLFLISGYEKFGSADKRNPFTDVNENTPHKDEIVTLFNMGLINGTGADTFSPGSYVTYGQALKMALNILGYKEYVNVRYGGNLEGYIIVAGKLKLTEDIKTYNANENISAADVAQLLYNTAKTPVYEVTSLKLDGEGMTESYDRGEILLSNDDVYYNEGIVQGNGIVCIDGSGSDANVAVIGGCKYIIENIDISEYLGCEVQYFYKKTSEKPVVLWAYPLDTTNMLEIDCDDLMVNDKSYSRTNIVYEVNNKSKKAKIDKYATIVYNNQIHNEYTGKQLKIKSGTIRLIDNNNDDVYDLVVVQEFKNIFVTTVADNHTFVTDKFGNSIYFDDYENVKIIHDGKFISVNEIPLNVVISLIESTDKNYLYMYVGQQGKKGVLDKYEDDGANSIYWFDETGYKLANSFLTVADNYHTVTPVVGNQYRYYVDISGKIAYLEETDAVKNKYAYLIKSAPDDDNFAKAGKAMFRFLLSDGTQVDVKSSDKLTLNGSENKSGEDVLNYIDNNGIELPVVVKAEFNSNSDLKVIDFAENVTNPYGYDQTKFTLDYEISGAEFGPDNVYMINKKYTVIPNTVCFVTNTSADEPDSYEVIQYNEIYDSTYDMKLYDCDANLEPKAISMVRNKTTRVIESIFVVDNVTRVLVDGVALKQIEGMARGVTVKYTEYAQGCIPDTLKKGDIVRLSAYDNRINKVTLLVSPSEKPSPFVKDFGTKTCYIFGQLYSKGVNNIVTVNPPGDSNGLLTGSVIRTNSSTRVTVFDNKTKEIYAGHVNDLYQINQPDANGNLPESENSVYCFIQRRYNYVTEIVAIYY